MDEEEIYELYEYLHTYLKYNPDTGKFIWIDRPKFANNVKIGMEAGSLNFKGYRVQGIKGNKYYQHRLAWLYVYGNFPGNEIDHINGIRDDNRICNLREVTSSQNNWNRSVSKYNKFGYKGVSWHKGKFRARIILLKQELHLGTFNTAEEAARAYDERAKELFGEFAVLNFPDE